MSHCLFIGRVVIGLGGAAKVAIKSVWVNRPNFFMGPRLLPSRITRLKVHSGFDALATDLATEGLIVPQVYACAFAQIRDVKKGLDCEGCIMERTCAFLAQGVIVLFYLSVRECAIF